ncbi:hypothetical protein AA313_de0206928 [Arthrobotrys entomopaga]|nr:hypothetical protein AA313_de0206928 [Arthrobotrys entomopaga]
MANDTDPKDQPSEPQSSPPSADTPTDTPPTPTPTPTEPVTEQEEKPLSRSALIEQAFRFLSESEVQNSTRTKKIAFLESKGLTRAEIDALLPVEKGVPSWQLAKSGTGKAAMVQAEPPMSLMPMTSESSAAASQPKRATETFSVPTAIPQNLPPRPSGGAPIVTFPEYIPPPPPPPPIFNTQTLTAGAYLFAGVSATIYAATKYYFQPMIDNLTDARLDFSSHTLTKLDEMNAKLSDLAHRPLPSETHPNPPFSVLQHKYPLTRLSRAAGTTDELLGDEDGLSDVESIYSYESTEPPTRTFHVDAQTQTSPNHTVASADDNTALPPDEKLDRIQRLLKSMKDEADDVVAAEGGDLGGNVKDLKEYLNSITYKATYGGVNSANSYLPPYVSITGGAGTGKGDEDEFSKVKAEIRSVKGVLLNM